MSIKYDKAFWKNRAFEYSSERNKQSKELARVVAENKKLRELIECPSCRGRGAFLGVSFGVCECGQCGGDGHRLHDMEGENLNTLLEEVKP